MSHISLAIQLLMFQELNSKCRAYLRSVLEFTKKYKLKMKEHFQDQSLEDVVSDTFDEDYQYDTNLPQTKFDSKQDYTMNESFGYRQGTTFTTKIYIITFQCFSGKCRSYISS